ncbi:MAG: serine/threonine-protein kinase, partial [Acidobacteriota bacterium]
MTAEMRNPFYHRQAVSDPSQVFGRAGLVRELFEMISSGQSCAVIGERRIGKSTLLSYLAARDVQEAHGLDPEQLLVGVLDFLALHGYSPDELWPEILDALALTASDSEVRGMLEAAAGSETLGFSHFRRILRRLRRRGYRIVLLCDELDLAVDNPLFDEPFFGALRSLAGEGVAYVTASRASLLELELYRSEEARRKVLASPFFNIFAQFTLGAFDDHEVAEWLAASLEQTPIRFDALDIAWLDEQAGRHPFFLQLAAYHLFGGLERRGLARTRNPRPEPSGRPSRRGAERDACRRAAAEQVRQESARIFRYQWRHSREDERGKLASMAADAATWREGWRGADEGTKRLLRRLERRGLLRLERSSVGQEGYRLFSRPFYDWLCTETSLGPLPMDSARTAAPSGSRVSGSEPASTSLSEPSGAPGGVEAAGERMTPPSAAGFAFGPEALRRASDRFQILEELGHGGTATVFKAWDLKLERLVALKFLDHALKQADRGRQLLEEARVCASLRHPNIVVIFDIDPDRGILVEEFLPGGSLRDLLEQAPVWRQDELLSVSAQLAGALQAAHAAGIVHADVKPENVLLTERARYHHDSAFGRRAPGVKLTDFGAAYRSWGATVAPGASGTLAYMAPEQLVGRGLTPAADVFSFGVVLWEVRHGERPEDG